MIFCVCIGAMSEQTEAKLELLKARRIHAVEIPGRVLEQTGREDPEAYRLSLETAAERLPTAGVNAVSVHLPFWPADISSLDPAERAFALAVIERSLAAYSEFFPGGLAVVHPGDIVAIESTVAERMAQSIESLCRVAEMAADVNVRLAILNMPPGSVTFPTKNRIGQEIDFILGALGAIGADHVGICFDTAHANVVGDVPEMARQCGEKLIHMHLGDNSGVAEDFARLRNRKVPGEGTVPWGELGDVLYEIGYAGAAVLEVGVSDDRSYEELIIETQNHLVDWVWMG